MIAFKDYEIINKLSSTVEKHRSWLKQYEGKRYSIALEGVDKIKWKETKYSDSLFSTEINKVGELKNRLRIEFDDKDDEGNKDKEKIKEHIVAIRSILKTHGWGYIQSTHNGASDYLWIEFNKDLKTEEKKRFLEWINLNNGEIDMNFASSKFVFPVLFALHWKHSDNREMPIEFNKGEQIDYDSLGLTKKAETRIIDDEGYTTFKKAFNIFSRKGQLKEFQEIQPLFYDKSGLWWLWNLEEFFWERVDEIDILNMIEKCTGEDIITSKNRTEILNGLKQEGRKRIPKPMNKNWVQFKDIIINVSNGEEFKATPEYFITNPIPWCLHKERFSLTPTMDKIFEEWVGEKYVKTLHEIIAYCLLPAYPIHRLFCFLGAGLNGKGCFLRLLRKFIGEKNVTATELDTLLSSRFEVTRLHKKLVCQMGETNFSELNKTSIIKKLTGEDLIGFEYKNKNPFDDNNYAKIIIATNNLPSTTDKTIGFYRRWMIIDFPNQFSEEKDILDEIPDEEYEALAVKSLLLLKDLLDTRKFSNEGSIEERTQKYEDKSNPFEKFWKENIIEDGNSHIWKHEFRDKLKDFCKEHRFRELSDVSIAKEMKSRNIEGSQMTVEEAIPDNYGNKPRWRCWIGISWKN